MSNKVGLILKLDGENQYTKALQNIKKETKLFQAELKNLDKSFEGNRNSMDALRKKQELLEKQQDSFKRQVDAAKNGLENARREYDKQSTALEELRKKLKDAEDTLKQMEATGDTSSEAYKRQTEYVNELRQAVDKQSENLMTASGRITDWNTKLVQAEGSLDACNKEIAKNEQYLDEASKSADGCATSIDGMGRDVIKASDDMDKLTKETDEAADSLDDADDSAKSLGLTFKDGIMVAAADMAMSALRELGEKAVEAAKYIIEVGSSFEAQMSKVEAISGSTASQMSKLTSKAQEMGRKTKFSATESGEAMEYMAMAGWKTEDMLEGIEGIMNLAAASGEDLGTTSDIVTDALTALGYSAKDAGRLADVMAVASSNANTNVSMMGETFKYVAPVAGAMGYNMEDTAEAIGLMANSGIKASQAGTSLRSVITRLATNAGASANKLGALDILTEKLGVQFYNTDGTARGLNDVLTDARAVWSSLTEEEQINYANTIAGKNAMSGWLALMNAAPEDVAKLENALAGADGAAERMAETMQDNLSGKLVILQSATEGLGIALYNHVSGPLQGAVELVTNVINGITDAITPQKTALSEFTDEIAASNREVEAMISHAGKTVENAELEVGKLETYETFISDVLDKCNDFNQIDLGKGKYQIVDSAGEVVRDGFGAIDEALANTENGLGNFGTDGINTAVIKGDTATITSYFNATGKQIRATSKRAKAFGEEGVTTKTFKDGTDTITEYFDKTGKKIGETRDQIVSLSEYDFHGLANSIGYVSDAENNVVTVTDEFTKFRIDAIVKDMADALPELAERWDSVHGTLQASNEEIERWFGNQKSLAMQDAITKATSELYTAQAEAILNLAKAKSAADELLNQYNEATGNQVTDIKEAFDALNDVWASMGSVTESGVSWDLYDSIKAIVDSMDEANGAIAESDSQLAGLYEVLGGLEEQYGLTSEETEEWANRNEKAGATAEEAAERIGALGDESEDAAGDVDELTEAENELTEAMQDAIKDGLEATAKAMESLRDKYKEYKDDIAKMTTEKVNMFEPFEYGKAGEDEAPVALQELTENLNKTKQSLLQWQADMKILAGEVGNTISAEFFEYVLAQGPDFSVQLQAMIGDLNTTGGEELRKLSDAWTGAVDMSEGVSVALANTQLAFEAGLHNIGSTHADFNDLRNSIDAAANNAVEGWNSLESGTVEKLQATVNAAEAMGIQIPDKLASGIRGGSTTPESALAQIEGAMTGTLEGMIDIATNAGVEIPESLRTGVDNGSIDVVDAYNAICTSLGNATGDFNAVGAQSASELASGIADNASEAEDAGSDVVKKSANAASSSIAIQYDTAGQLAPQSFAIGMRSKESYATDEADDMGKNAAAAAGGHDSEWQTAGKTNADSYVAGMSGKQNEAQNAAAQLANAAAGQLSQMERALYNPGWNTAIGFAQGMIDAAPEVRNAAAFVANEALTAAKNALQIHSPSKRARVELGGNYTAGFVQGLDEGADSIRGAMLVPVREGMTEAERLINSWYPAIDEALNWPTAKEFARAAAQGGNTNRNTQSDSVLNGFGSGNNNSAPVVLPETIPGGFNGNTQTELLRYLRNHSATATVSAASSITVNDLLNVKSAITDASDAIKDLTEAINDWRDSDTRSTSSYTQQAPSGLFASQVGDIAQREINLRSKRIAMSLGR